MESLYAMVAIGEGIGILFLIAILIAQHSTIKEYRRDYLSRGSAQKYART